MSARFIIRAAFAMIVVLLVQPVFLASTDDIAFAGRGPDKHKVPPGRLKKAARATEPELSGTPTASPTVAPTSTATPEATATPSPATIPTSTALPNPTIVPSPTITPSPSPSSPAGGTAPVSCQTSLQSLIDAAAPGSVVAVPPCTYRETVTIPKPLTLAGQPGTEIRGSDVWTEWTRSGSFWVSAGTVPSFSIRSGVQCVPGTARCLWPEQVFFDGRPLEQVAANPERGQFAVSDQRRVLLADDPSGHTVEVTTRPGWVNVHSNNVTISRFTMRHAANDAQWGALGTYAQSFFTLQDSILSDTHGPVVSISKSNGSRLLRNDISRGGQEGVQGWDADNTLIQGNKIHHNNTEGYDQYWEAGGLKMATHRGLVLADNEVHDNAGPGLWCDIGCVDVTYSNNRVYRNLGVGVFFEISNGAKIFGNSVWENEGWAGIYVSSSANADVYHNTLAWNRGAGIFISSEGREDRTYNQVGTIGNFIHDNAIVMPSIEQSALKWWQGWSGILFNAASNNRVANNTYWGEPGRVRLEWDGRHSYISPTEGSPLDEGGRYLADAEKDQQLALSGIPLTPSQ